MNTIAFIFARGGSKGLPGKNIRQFAGKPLVVWAIEHAKAVNRIRRVIVSTDDKEIAVIARKNGAEVPFIRPSHLAEDCSPEWLAWRHALKFVRDDEGTLPEAMVTVPTTAPLRLPMDIENCLDEFEKSNVDVVITVSEARRNPFFNMIKANKDGSVDLVMRPNKLISRRQDVPPVYDMTTVAYVARPEFVLTKESIFEGKVKAVQVPIERSIDIDKLIDLEIAEFIYKKDKET